MLWCSLRHISLFQGLVWTLHWLVKRDTSPFVHGIQSDLFFHVFIEWLEYFVNHFLLHCNCCPLLLVQSLPNFHLNTEVYFLSFYFLMEILCNRSLPHKVTDWHLLLENIFFSEKHLWLFDCYDPFVLSEVLENLFWNIKFSSYSILVCSIFRLNVNSALLFSIFILNFDLHCLADKSS